MAIDHYEIEHFRAGKHLDLASGNLGAHSLVGAEEKLLAGLTSSIEGSRNLRAAKGAVCKEPAIFAREGNPLRDTLVDDQRADFGKPVNICFAGSKIAALYGVVEKTIDAVAVVLIVFCGVYSALCGDRVRAARAVLVAKALDVEALFAQRCGGGRAGQAAAHDNKLVLSLIRGTDDFGVIFVGGPLFFEWTGRDVSVERHCTIPFPRPKKRTDTGIEIYPTNKTQANIGAPVS